VWRRSARIEPQALMGRSSRRRTAQRRELSKHGADRSRIRADGTDLAYVDLTLQDAAGVVFAGQDRAVTVRVEGPAVLAGSGSARPATEESYLDEVSTTFDGRALAVVRPTGGGTVTVTASAPDCQDVVLVLEAR
jgi:beta-galactosidase